MIRFVNAKINIGLNIVRKREDGYHDLETVFFPIGLHCGLPHHPESFVDILEVVVNTDSNGECLFDFLGKKINCEVGNNIVEKAANLFMKCYAEKEEGSRYPGMFQITLDKHLPDGAGLGGGSADGAFTLSTMNEVSGEPFTKEELFEMARQLGADCPFFLYNKPCFAEGIGEILTPLDLSLSGKYILIVKPPVYISTKEAFSKIVPSSPTFDLREIGDLQLDQWRGKIKNDFEDSVFPQYPELKEIKESMYKTGAVYASMSGSGSSIYGIFENKEVGEASREFFKSTYSDVWLFGI